MSIREEPRQNQAGFNKNIFITEPLLPLARAVCEPAVFIDGTGQIVTGVIT